MTTNAQVFEITIKSDHDSVPRVSAELISNFLIYSYGERRYREICDGITQSQEWHRLNCLHQVMHIVTIEGNDSMLGRRIYDKLIELYPNWQLQIECKKQFIKINKSCP